jgi:hypothetical protein
MNKAQQILEKFFKGTKGRFGSYTEVFVNPTGKELEDLKSTTRYQEVRFVADPVTHQVYVWDSDAETHPLMMSKLNSKWSSDTWRTAAGLLLGTAKWSGNKFVLEYIDRLEFMPREKAVEHFRKDWTWVDKYISVTPFMKKYKSQWVK